MVVINVERDAVVDMRDGVELRADIYRPQTNSPLPVLLQRTPYGKNFVTPCFALEAAERGYVVVVQDTRGRWNSSGEWYPFVNEGQDGYDTVQWAARQPWSNGLVGMFGESYVGYTQLAAAAAGPPALKTIIPEQTFCRPYDFVYHGGAFALGATTSWSLLAGALMAIQRSPLAEEARQSLFAEFIALADGMTTRNTFRWQPLEDMPMIGRQGVVNYFADTLAHPVYDDYWAQVTCAYEDIKVPAYHWGSWYDLFAASTLNDYTGLAAMERPPVQKLVMGPWKHGGNYENRVGEVDFGVQSSWIYVLPEEDKFHWLDYWLKGAANGILDEPTVKLFVMGENRWRTEQEWPLARTRYIPYYLHSQGSANTAAGDGELSRQPPSDEPVDTYIYNPDDPVPTHGGGVCCWEAALPAGAYDQRQVEQRPDVLVYTTPPLEKPLEVTGKLRVRLWAATSGVDTDFTAKLVDVRPDGFARNLQDGIVRAGAVYGGHLHPGEVYEYEIDLAATSNVFLAGHRIRLEIASSNFPRFARNPNTGKAAGIAIAMQPANQTILHNPRYPSHILLPVISR